MQFVDETDSDRGMMFSQQFTFNRQTRQHCPKIVNPFHPKKKEMMLSSGHLNCIMLWS